MQRLIFIALIFSIITGCKSSKIPAKRLSQYSFYTSLQHENDCLIFEIKNPLHCSLRISYSSKDKIIQEQLGKITPIILAAKSDTTIQLKGIKKIKSGIKSSSKLGSLNKKITVPKIELPFPKGRTYSVIQGNNSTPTHNTEWSKYAIDFSLKIKDTICAATSGFVVGVIDGYKYGGSDEKWKHYGNFITIYEPNSGVFTQYVHLVYEGSFVKLGDKIHSGQPIGLSGITGQTNIEHLHFNCLIPTKSNAGLKSIPFEFIEGFKCGELKRNDQLKK